MTLLRSVLPVIALVAVVALGLWWWGLPTGTPELSSEVIVSSTDAELLNSLISLKAVTLSGTIFSDPAFVSLNDVGVEIVPEPTGRRNPFAPLPPISVTGPRPTTLPLTPLPAQRNQQ